MHLFLEKLCKGGRQDGFLDPATEGLGLMWATVSWGGIGSCSPLDSTFYLRKGGARKLTERKRQTMRELMLKCAGIDAVCVKTIENELGDDLLPKIVTSGREDQPHLVYLWHLGSRCQVEVKVVSEPGTTYYELGKRRMRMLGKQPNRVPSASADQVHVQTRDGLTRDTYVCHALSGVVSDVKPAQYVTNILHDRRLTLPATRPRMHAAAATTATHLSGLRAFPAARSEALRQMPLADHSRSGPSAAAGIARGCGRVLC